MPIVTYLPKEGAAPVIPALGFPALTVSIGRPSGWQLGVAGFSELGETTVLGGIEYEAITVPTIPVTIHRGRQHELDRIETGLGSSELLNQDGAFNATNTTSPWHPLIRPMTPVKVEATFNGVVYPVYSGFAEAWPATWSGARELGLDYVALKLADGQKVLNLARVTATRPQELSGARIAAVLDAIGWPASLQAIDAGESQVQAVELEDANVLSHIQEIAASDGGQFFIAADGTATFFDRFHTTLLDETNDVWGDADGEKHYASIRTSYDDQTLWNRVVVSAPGLVDQIAEDAASQVLYGGPAENANRTLSVSTLLTSEVEMLERAEFLLSKYAEPQFRITSLTIDNASLDDSQWPRLLGADLHHRVLVRKRPVQGDPIEQPSFVEGIDWTIDVNGWRLTWALSSTALQQGQWQLGVAGKSELGLTTSLVGN